MRLPPSSAQDPSRSLRRLAGTVCVTGLGLSAAAGWWLGDVGSADSAWWRPLPLLGAMGGIGATLALSWSLLDASRRWRTMWQAGAQLMQDKQDQQRLLRTTLAQTSEAILTVSAQGVIVQANAAAALCFQQEVAQLCGRPLSTLIGPTPVRPQESLAEVLSRLLIQTDGCARRTHGRCASGRQIPLEVSVVPLPGQVDGHHLLVMRDLSQQDLADRAATEARRQLDEVDEMRRVIVHNAPYAIFVLNPHGVIQTVNPAAEQLVGYSARELVGRSTTQRFFSPDQVAERARMLALRLNQPVQELNVLEHLAAESPGVPTEWLLRRADGNDLVTEITVTELRDELGTLTGYLAMAYDVTSRRDAEHQLQHMAQHDALTSLPNRTMLQEQLKQNMALAERQERPLGLMFLDIDRFKKINDGLGHQVGDLVLVEVAHRLRRTMRTSDVVARLGGDEFVVLLSELNEAGDAQLVADKVLQLFNEPLHIAGHELRITPSIGVALFPAHGRDTISLMRHADLAMYQAKSAGRNRVQVYSDSMGAPSVDTLVLESDLYRAIERNELRLHFQPQFDCQTGAITGAEALLRWEHKGRLVPPSDFIPLAEETGLIVPIGEWVMRQACASAQDWHSRFGIDLRMAVNLSAVQLDNQDVPALVSRVLADTGLPPTALELEITESVVVRESLRAADILRQLRALGVRLAIDDFGVGYSSFAYLRELPVDRLKLDRSFLMSVPQSQGDARLMAALIAMGHRLQVHIVAEGVETAEQAAFLKAHGCDEAQGYHLGRPMPHCAFEALLLAHAAQPAAAGVPPDAPGAHSGAPDDALTAPAPL